MSAGANTPELDPVEHLWDELCEKFFHNLVFDSLDALGRYPEYALTHVNGRIALQGDTSG